MKLFSLNYVREGILMLIVIVFSGILIWNLMRRPSLEGVDTTLEAAADAKLDATNKQAELDAKTAASKADIAIQQAKLDIVRAEAKKTAAKKLVDEAEPNAKAAAQSNFNEIKAKEDLVIAEANVKISAAKSTMKIAADKRDVAMSIAEAEAKQDKADAKQSADKNKALGETYS